MPTFQENHLNDALYKKIHRTQQPKETDQISFLNFEAKALEQILLQSSERTGWKMLKNPGQVGSRKCSPSESTPLTVRNIAIGEPRAKNALGLNCSWGYWTSGTPVPPAPTTKLTDVFEADLNNGSWLKTTNNFFVMFTFCNRFWSKFHLSQL